MQRTTKGNTTNFRNDLDIQNILSIPLENKPKQKRTSCETHKQPQHHPQNTQHKHRRQTAPNQPTLHQKACHAPAMKSKEATPKYQKEQHPTTEDTKATNSRSRTAPPQQRKAEQTQPDPLSSCHKGTLNKDNPSTAQPSRRNISQTPTFHMEQITETTITRTIPSPQAPQGYAPPRGGAATDNLHPSPRRQT